ncbi:MAG: hypothetical protein M3314_11765 [Actinomycetota bacterium]|nr:hypothetical protein [Actinomycetota bacterium]
MNHPFSAEHQVRERQEELLLLAQSAQAARRARTGRPGAGLEHWRRALARTLVVLGVTVGLPRERRRPAVEDAIALLDRNCCLT